MAQTTELKRLHSGEELRPAIKHPIISRFMENRLAVAGLIVVALFYFIAIIAPVIQRYPDNQIQPGARDLHPSAQHWLGTDRNGRDVYSRLLNGGRISLAVGFTAVAIIMTIGTTLGAISGYFGGWIDSVIMRFTDILLAIPQILLLIAASALFQGGILVTIIVIGVTSWPGCARLVRGQFLTLKDQEFITAARTIGARPREIIWRHLFPNSLAVIIVEATLWLSFAIILEASLSYLGLGVQIPTPSWGNMLQDGQHEMLAGAWWLTVFPGLAIFLVVMAFNLMGDGLRDAFDPR
ncbi:MAG TPA: oligopeptide ABC transporter permease, partial [Thermomicrobiaceae bacterium]|nr:oligopeptide ABC transporter permease [Thermomicrobiaceae bacterium]